MVPDMQSVGTVGNLPRLKSFPSDWCSVLGTTSPDDPQSAF